MPFDQIEQLTFGREAELKKLTQWLNDSARATFAVRGAYGAGKTHLLRCIYGQALQNHWAVAFAEVDPADSPFHKPKRL